MADLKINQVGLATMVVTLLGIDNDGNLKRISIADVLAAFGVRNYGVISKQDLDDCMTGWGYCRSYKWLFPISKQFGMQITNTCRLEWE